MGIFKKKKYKMERVYAGPEEMGKKSYEMRDVYAGPDQPGGRMNFDINGVYAGPAQMDVNIVKPVPSLQKPEAEMRCVYAGPEYFKQQALQKTEQAPEEQPVYPFTNAAQGGGTVTCPSCGAEVANAKFCENCGSKIN